METAAWWAINRAQSRPQGKDVGLAILIQQPQTGMSAAQGNSGAEQRLPE